MKQIIKWIMAILLATVSVFGVIFLPEYIADRYDDSYLNAYQLYAQETSVTSSTNLSVEEKLKMLCAYGNGQNSIDILIKESLSDLEKNDENLLAALKQEVHEMEERTLLPKISSSIDFEEDYVYARLQAFTVDGSPGKILYLWTICFFSVEGEYYFWVDADTYQIYAVNIFTDSPVNEYIDSATKKWGSTANEMTLQWTKAFVDYLWADEAKDSQEDEVGETEKQDVPARISVMPYRIFTLPDYDGYQLFAHIENIGNVECYMYCVNESIEEYSSYFSYYNFSFGFENFLETGNYSISGYDKY